MLLKSSPFLTILNTWIKENNILDNKEIITTIITNNITNNKIIISKLTKCNNITVGSFNK